MPPEAFPTGRTAHRKCPECGDTWHVYMFPVVDRTTGERGPVCLPCVNDRKLAEHIERLRRGR